MIVRPSDLPGYPVAVQARIYTAELPPEWREPREVFATHNRAAMNQFLAAWNRMGFARLQTRIGPQPGLGNFWPRWATHPVRAVVQGRSLLWGWAVDDRTRRSAATALGNAALVFRGERIAPRHFEVGRR